MLHATKDVEGVGSGTIVQNCSLHVIMKGLHDAEKVRRTTDVGQNLADLLTRSNALVRSMKRGFPCSLHFSCSCLSEKIMSMVALFALNLH